VVLRHVQALVDAGVTPKDIGVITPYNAQVNMIRNKMQTVCPGVEVATVDGFQGREKEAIVISMVRSNEAPHNVGFLKDDRRMNVAITRARRHVCVVCDGETVSTHPFLKRMIGYFQRHGVVLSATEYIESEFDELVEEDQLTLTHLEDEEDEKESSAGPSKKNQNQGKMSKQDRKNKKKKDEMDAKMEKYEKQLKEMKAGNGPEKTSFPASLSSYERAMIHEIAERLQLVHLSVGEGANRQLVVSRSQPDQRTIVHEDEVVEEDEDEEEGGGGEEEEGEGKGEEEEEVMEEGEGKGEEEEEEKGDVDSEVQNTPKKKKKNKTKVTPNTLYPKEILGMALDHEKGDNGKANNLSTPKQKNKKKPQQRQDRYVDLPSLDDILIKDTSIKDENACFVTGCTKNVLISRTCEFCKHKYCLYHGIPEGHGCGAAAKKKARSEWIKQNATDTRNPEKKDALHSKLQKKISEASDTRSKKLKDNKNKGKK